MEELGLAEQMVVDTASAVVQAYGEDEAITNLLQTREQLSSGDQATLFATFCKRIVDAICKGSPMDMSKSHSQATCTLAYLYILKNHYSPLHWSNQE